MKKRNLAFAKNIDTIYFFPNIVSQYCVEIYYQICCTGKKYFSIGFKNNSGVCELSIYYGKTCTGPKDIRWIKNAVHLLLVFEGFFDFLSFVQINENYVNISRKSFDVLSSVWQANHDFLLLNYLFLYTKLTSFFLKYKTVGLLQDNHYTVKRIPQKIFLENKKIIDYSERYKNNKHLNALQTDKNNRNNRSRFFSSKR